MYASLCTLVLCPTLVGGHPNRALTWGSSVLGTQGRGSKQGNFRTLRAVPLTVPTGESRSQCAGERSGMKPAQSPGASQNELLSSVPVIPTLKKTCFSHTKAANTTKLP